MKLLISLVWLLVTPILTWGAVIKATDKTFDSLVNSGTPALVEFYASWCGHCKTLEPTYQDLGKLYVNSEETAAVARGAKLVNIIKIDGDIYRKISKRFAVRGYPTLLWFNGKSNDFEPYTGKGRELENFTSFIESKTGIKPLASALVSNVVTLESQADLDHLLASGKKAVFLAVTATWCGHCKNLLPLWEQLADIYSLDADKIAIARIDGPSNGDFTRTYGISQYPTILFYDLSISSDPKPLLWDADRHLETFIKFINGHVGTFRNTAGELNSEAGVLRTEEIESILTTIYNEALAQAPIERMSTLVDQLNQHIVTPDQARYYIHVANSIIKKGPMYVSKEATRLQNLLSKSKIQAQKRDELTQKLNVLNHYLGSAQTLPVHDEL
ncbi:thioredoxin-like protein [Nadsonia fulvescens var. elongata DSM 6958]|uniref:protein disulfide-isomerase n=1 Tax=Nadsonia fulvescens var. elongata DSM 6958 TaxID=857566 RepID=A0A1E3PTP3_9ASCO|nr:thioredoxin-like protein [Nadsonia fulvescens var. elongata DSM 6958]